MERAGELNCVSLVRQRGFFCLRVRSTNHSDKIAILLIQYQLCAGAAFCFFGSERERKPRGGDPRRTDCSRQLYDWRIVSGPIQTPERVRQRLCQSRIPDRFNVSICTVPQRKGVGEALGNRFNIAAGRAMRINQGCRTA